MENTVKAHHMASAGGSDVCPEQESTKRTKCKFE
jgi:hypothetical protein